ncbi:hypothetical protein L1267_18025 [Pseudoalteromonas sp. OFAV1]|jgi:hypothetical protein|uniref:hypothetical protein n=1 Tax=Pseudoalteromonas sp. OFAV1 TaxID=2908892 RepID=UPI001F472C51|nr:hypothetical protein [Pseudoalteromonas sp. OFAV1]MCF2902271.1 hypothetical protein [Pseudoalteromonas sp. OFAV1]
MNKRLLLALVVSTTLTACGGGGGGDKGKTEVIADTLEQTRTSVKNEIIEASSQYDYNTSFENVYTFYEKLGYETGVVEKSGLESTSELSVVFSYKETFKDSIDSLLTKVGSATSESVLKGYLNDLASIESQYEQNVIQNLKGFEVVNKGYMPDVSVTAFTEYDGKSTLFEGNSKFGEEKDGKWVFNTEYKFLETMSVVAGTCEMEI